MSRAPYVGAIAVDAKSGTVLSEDHADEIAYPASVTKLMTAYLVLDEIQSGRLALSTPVVASAPKSKADSHFRQPSCIGLQAGESMTVDDLLKALMVHSANDAAIFLAEKCAGSVAEFVKRMNEKAAALGMKNTRYYNPNGLPPANVRSREFNVSTCRDLARLALGILKNHPEILTYTSIKAYDVNLPNGKKTRFVNHNNVMVKDKMKIINPDGSEAVDGLKTGYITAGGSSVILTGKRKGRRAVVVVLGSVNPKERDANASRLMSDALGAIAW